MAVRLPAEWEPQDAVVLSWPYAKSDWRHNLADVEDLYQDLVSKLAGFVPVIVITAKGDSPKIEGLLPQQTNFTIRLYEISCDDTWARDYGPISIYKDGQAQALDFEFNGWGNKFSALLDNAVTAKLAVLTSFSATKIPMVLEGGAIESDGNGCLMTTRKCVLNTNRNGPTSQLAVDEALSTLLGVSKINYLSYGYLAGDDTDSHIDTLARLCPNNTITYVKCDDPQDEHYAELAAMEAELSTISNANGDNYALTPLPMPCAKYDADGRRLPATYANFLISNGAVFVPVYNDEKDALALKQLAKVFPNRTIVAINCLPLIQQNGSLHCITMQLPKGLLRENAL